MSDIAADVEKALQSSMFQRVPEIAADFVRSGMEPTEAIRQAIIKAKAREDELCAVMAGGGSFYWEQEAVKALKDALCTRVYNRLRARPPVAPSVNPRWAECERHLGRAPTTTEFLTWSHGARSC